MAKTNNEYDSGEVPLEETAQEVEKTKKIVDLKVIVLYFLLIALFVTIVFFLWNNTCFDKSNAFWNTLADKLTI